MKKNLLPILITLAIALSLFPVLASAARVGVQSVSGYFTTVGANPSNIYYSTGAVGIITASPTATGLSVQGQATTSTSDIFNVSSSTAVSLFSIGPTGTTTMKQYVGFGLPTIATSTGAGTPNATSTLTSGSSDLSGIITVVTGSNPATKSTIATFTYASSTSPFCVYSPANGQSSLISTSTFLSLGASSFSIIASTSPLVASTTYQWSYLCN